ncbi:hypothetical protein N665_1069s0002 [Sinapis alba]|nr:hypothetical protein N665_1069s0002 [Sinapis alba]
MEVAELSVNTVVGLSSPHTIKLQGSLQDVEVVVLIDTGATHNFISESLVQRLGIPVSSTQGFVVMVGAGVTVKGRRVCEGIQLKLPTCEVNSIFLPLELGIADVILGIQWLETLGETQNNWKLQCMKFQLGGETITIQGDPSLYSAQLSLKALWKAVEGVGEGLMVEYGGLQAKIEEKANELPRGYLWIEDDFGTVFQEPSGLPPIRSKEHTITFTTGASPRRFCVDYRELNKVTVADKYPIPLIDQLLDELQGAKVFSKLDLRAGRYVGNYKFLVMPFGLTNAPTTFESLMNEAFRPYLRSRTEQEHQEHLREILEQLRRHKLYANQKKCSFGSKRIEYLGYIITHEGVSADETKIKTMVDWPKLKNVKELRGFLGLTGYYRKFVREYGLIARPLTTLLKKDQFSWNVEAQNAFQRLKTAMTTIPILALPNFDITFIIESDASGVGLGDVLMQNQRPLAYYSQALSDRQRLKYVYEIEMMAIVLAVQKWNHYLVGRKFVVRTDQKSLKFLLEKREINLEYHKWLTKLLGFDFEIHYRPGLENKAAYVLSQRVEPYSSKNIAGEVDQYQELNAIREEVMKGSKDHTGYTLVHGRLLRHGKLVLPANSKLREVILKEFHSRKV